MSIKNLAPGVSSAQDRNTTSIDNYAFLGYKCFADTECDESPSAGWQFIKFCMRG